VPPRPPVAEKPRRPRLRKLRFALVFLGLSLLAFVSWIFGIMMAVAQDLPALENRAQYERAENSIVYDATGQKLATLTNNEGRILITSEEIAPSMKAAVVAIEDQRFYDHRGVDFQGIARAVFQDILAQSAQQGASTITQQFVKNALAAQEDRTVFQKLREAALAYHLERQWSKDKILTEYLNSIYFGEGAYGIEAAARTYFGYNHPGCGEGEDATPCASQLLPYESALLAGMISSPSAYSPRSNPDSAVARRNLVMDRMVENGSITETEYADYALMDIPNANQIAPPAENSEAPYFTSWLRQQLVDQYGAGEAFGGGLEITSSLDLDLQREVESITSGTLAGIEPTASVVVLDNDTGTVRAMVGGPSYQEAPFNLATNGQRQPGSAFKPFTLVAALEQGHSTSEVYSSAPKDIPFKAKFEKNGKTKTVSELFDVNNYEDQYLGSASLSTATTYSDNSVYAELGLQVGPHNVAATAEKMGIETDLSTETEYSINGGEYQPYNPAMILGGLAEGVTPLEMAHAYETLAAGGKRISGTMASSSGGPVGIVEVRDRGEDGVPGNNDGELVKDNDGGSGANKVVAKQVVDPTAAETAVTTLQSVVTSGTGENAATDEPTWGKTGTTDDNGDAWFVGATDEITVAVWVGHADSNTPMETEFAGAPVDGGTFPALIFARVVDAWESVQAGNQADNETEEEDDETSTTPAPPVDTTTTPDTAPVPPETDGGGGGETDAGGDPGSAGGGAPATDGGGLAVP
jgi:penicillin-binding protein 1A